MDKQFEQAYKTLCEHRTEKQIQEDLDLLHQKGFILLVARLRAIHQRTKPDESTSVKE